MQKTQKKKPRFYIYFNSLLLVLVILGFGSRALLQPEDLPPMRPVLLIHIIVLFGWYVLMVIQSLLITSRKPKIHMNLGWASVGLAVAVVVTILCFFFAPSNPDLPLSQLAPNLTIPAVFATCYITAIVWYKDLAFHKRMMTFASIAMMPPALTRLSMALLGGPVLSIPLTFILQATLPIYDKVVDGKVSSASKLGVSLVLFQLVIDISLVVMGL